MSETKWNIKKQDKTQAEILSKHFKINEYTARLLINRGYETEEKAAYFFNKSEEKLHDPFLLNDMDKAVDRLHQAYINGEKILIYGDYDVDGISATCVVYLYLRRKGFDISYFIPDRFDEGYGINNEALKKANEYNISLMITVDTGITAVQEIKYANDLNIDVIITDHHECCEELPKAVAVINPKRLDSSYPFKELAGVGVAYKLIQAYSRKYEDGNISEEYTEFVAMGTIADIMPLEDENIVMTYIGLKSMKNSANFGIKAILEQCFQQRNSPVVAASVISYSMAPRINASGRLYNASKSVELFLAENKKEADLIAEELSLMNEQRKNTEKEILFEAVKKITKKLEEDEKIIILCDDSWNQGIIGIVASKLLEKYNRAIIMLTKENEDTYKGSCRSLKNINITEALKNCSELLVKFGGHELAAGLTVKKDKIDELERRLNEYVKLNNIEILQEKIIDVDFEINPSKVNLPLIREIFSMEPFGSRNPSPLFAVMSCKVKNITSFSGNRHVKIFLRSDNFDFEAMMFNYDVKNISFKAGDIIDILCELGINTYKDNEYIQILVREFKIGTQNETSEGRYDFYYNKFVSNELVEYDKIGRIDREDFSEIYKFLLSKYKKDTEYSLLVSEFDFFRQHKSKNTFVKYKIIMDIFCEMNIIDITYKKENGNILIETLKLNNTEGKIDLESSSVYKKYKNFYSK